MIAARPLKSVCTVYVTRKASQIANDYSFYILDDIPGIVRGFAEEITMEVGGCGQVSL